MENRGKKVKIILNDLGIKIKSVAIILDKHEKYVYQMLDREELSWDIIKKIGKGIGYDFSQNFPDMPKYLDYPVKHLDSQNLKEPLPLEKEVKKWKDKYFQLLEDVRHNDGENRTA